MIFSGPDLLVANFEISALVVTRNVLTADALENAASRLLEAWPMLSFRTSLRVSFQASIFTFDTDGIHTARPCVRMPG